ncbi:MAG: hypothetical protein AAGK97_07785, partial [Bacteroidota bacterium]
NQTERILTILDQFGKKVYQVQNEVMMNESIDVDFLQQGLYTLYIDTGNTQFRARFLKLDAGF